MLGDVVAVDAGFVGLRHQTQAIFVLLRQVTIMTALEMIENELHSACVGGNVAPIQAAAASECRISALR